jgi:hypothetical protein
MGCRLLDDLSETIFRFWRIYDQDGGAGLTVDELYIRVMRTWLIASLFHDVGYAAEILSEVSKKLQDLFFQHVPGFKLSRLTLTPEKYVDDEINDFLSLLAAVFKEDEFAFDLSEIKTAIQNRPSADSGIFTAMTALFRDQLEALDHGVVSALFLLLTLKVDIHEMAWQIDETLPIEAQIAKGAEWRSNFHARRDGVIEDIVSASLAIALHNIRQTCYKGLTVDFTTHPIAYLLMLCDDLHEWDRKADWERTSQALRAVYGFRVFPRLGSAANVFKNCVQKTSLHGENVQSETLFHFLCERVKRHGDSRVDCSDRRFRAVVNQLENALAGAKTSDVWEVRRLLEKRLVSAMPLMEPPWAAPLIQAALQQLTNDVVSMTYIGGDRTRPWNNGGNRMREIWQTFETIYNKNLANGPAVCLLHGFDPESVELFFVAEYSNALKSYVVDRSLPTYQNWGEPRSIR